MKLHDNEASIRMIDTKQKLQETLERQLGVLRNLLSNLSQEQQALSKENFAALAGVVDDRFHLLSVFEKWNLHFMLLVDELAEELGLPFIKGENLYFASVLEWLQKHLLPIDFELLLLCEQLFGILAELHEESAAVINFVAHEASAFQDLQGPKISLPHIAIATMELDSEE